MQIYAYSEASSPHLTISYISDKINIANHSSYPEGRRHTHLHDIVIVNLHLVAATIYLITNTIIQNNQTATKCRFTAGRVI